MPQTTHEEDTEDSIEQIAIIGMSGRFPGAATIAEFWQNLCDGRESTTFFSDEELLAEKVDPAMLNMPNYVKALPALDNVDKFDARFFGISPMEAQLMDPQHRIFLECAWEAMEDAAYAPGEFDGLTSVFAGASANSYMLNNLWSNRSLLTSVGATTLATANSTDYLATRVAYRLNLTGSSFSVQSACSTSLLATHLACQHLLTYQCDMAIAGGVSVFSSRNGYVYEEGGTQSPDGHVRPFDANAQGTVFGNAVGAIILKRLSEAIADGDQIYAVIRGSATNNDGSNKVGFTAPSLDGQVEAIMMAHMAAEVDPATIDYIEAHGTGTILGDPIEIDALTKAFRAETDERQYCAVGSVKGNIGHTDAAAGVTGIIKTALALKHGKLPPSINYESANPSIDFANSPFFVNTELRDWQRNGHPRRAGVSSLGIGGTNVHAILEEAPVVATAPAARRHQLLTLSAKSETALTALSQGLADQLANSSQPALADVAYTTNTGRSAFDLRRIAVATDVQSASAALLGADSPLVIAGAVAQSDSVAFLLSGQGSQHVNMGRDLYEQEPVYREQIDACAALLTSILGRDIREILFPAVGDEDAATELLNQTRFTQPALFMTEYALAQLWASWDIRPKALLGHSIGEYTAACLAGVFSLPDALKLVCERGRLMQSMAAGAMLAVVLAETELAPYLSETVALAVVNGPAQCTVAGPTEAIDALEAQLTADEIVCRRVRTSHAFHSAMMEPMLLAFEQVVGRVTLNAPQIPMLSNVSGGWLSAENATSPAYWASHVRTTVRFADGLEQLMAEPTIALLEVGPGTALKTLAQRHPSRQPDQATIASMRHPREKLPDDAVILRSLGQLWISGYAVDWTCLYANQQRQRVSLPPYPFERERYWIEPDESSVSATGPLTKNADLADWFYVPTWQRSVAPVAEATDSDDSWLIFSNDDALSNAFADLLGEQTTAHVLAGSQFAVNGDRTTIDPSNPDDYAQFITTLAEQNRLPQHIVHLWNAVDTAEPYPQWRSFYSLVYLAQALAKQPDARSCRLTIVSTQMQDPSDTQTLVPEKALLLGPLKVIAQELGPVTTQSVDLGVIVDARATALQLLAETQAQRDEQVVAYRGRRRWVQTFEAARLDSAENVLDKRLRDGGVYLITGGLGGIGLTLAKFLAVQHQAKIVLTSRSNFPARENWAQWIATHDATDRTSQRIVALQELESAEAEVLIISADVSDRSALQNAIAQTKQTFGALHGVIHAAGLPGGGIIPLKTEAAARHVLTPKVNGTRNLFAALSTETALDFVLLCSSITAITGGVGQVDYTAANAYLDAVAQQHNGRNGTQVVAVNWDAWAEVGMAVNTAHNFTSADDELRSGAAVDHDLLEQRFDEADGSTTYQLTMDPSRHWVLSEHSILGIPTATGTTHLEMARAAFRDLTGHAQMRFPEAVFLAPLQVNMGDRKTTQLVLTPSGDGQHFRVRSQSGITASGEVKWDIHADGKVAALDPLATVPSYDLDELLASCQDREISLADSEFQGREGSVGLGKRWEVLRHVYAGKNRALARLELKPDLHDDLHSLLMHPGILDVATSFSIGVDTDELHLPLSYRNLRVYAPLPAELYSFIRREESAVGKQTVTFTVTLLDAAGNTLAEAEEFTMKRVGSGAVNRILEKGSEKDEAVGHSAEKSPVRHFAITPAEGVELFQRILARSDLPQLTTSTRNLPRLIKQMAQSDPQALLARSAALPTTKHARPSLATGYVAPRSDVEEQVATIWQDVLGLEKVGVHDNLFDLGGDSLLAIQFGSRLSSAFNFSVPVRTVFENPTVAELAAALLLMQADEDGDGYTAIMPRPDADAPAPLSISQRRLWVFDQLNPQMVAYNLSHHVQLDGDLDVERMAATLAKVVARHAVLRTVFQTDEDGNPRQIIRPNLSIPLERTDLSAVQNGSREETLRSTILQRILQPFDLHNGPLLRLTLIRQAADRHVLQIIMHHIIGDATSIFIIMRDVMQFYGGAALAALPIQYADFASWQREKLNAGGMDDSLRYWREKLAGIPSYLKLPTDFARPAQQSYEGDRVEVEISAELTTKLRQFSRRHQVTVYTTLLAALNMLLARYSGENDIVVGATSAGRGRPELQNLIGFFINNLVLRSDLSNNPSAVDLVQQLKRTLLEAQTHEEVPFEQIIDAVNPPRDLSYTPLFQTMLTYVPKGSFESSWSGLEMSTVPIHPHTAQYDINILLQENDHTIVGIWEYCSALFTQRTAAQMVRHFVALLNALVTEPDRGFEQLPLLDSAETAQLLHDWNDTQTAYPSDQSVTQLFEAQATSTPTRRALAYADAALTYGELNARANQLARYLQAQGVRSGDLVGVHLRRSLEQLVALLAVGKVGAAYVPLDPMFPEQRLRYMIADSDMQVVLTDAASDAALLDAVAKPIFVGAISAELTDLPSANLNLASDPSRSAYVIYTSGSTGNPKGVLVPQRALTNFLCAMRDQPGISADDVLLSVTTLSFDIAGLELYLPLLAGAQVIIAEPDTTMDGRKLARTLDAAGVTILQATPATWRMLLDAGWQGKADLTMLCGGEPLPEPLAEQLLPLGAELWNMYGPTETTIWSTVARVEANKPITIGQPIANTQVYVLDKHMQPVPIGVAGQLWIGGDGVTTGYLNRPELTAERFVKVARQEDKETRSKHYPTSPLLPLPTSQLPVYNTGDLAHWNADGSLTCLGRTDAQVKLRGFRIELGDIECQLERHERVAAAAVTVFERDGDKRLAGYWVRAGDEMISAETMRGWLAQSLPLYMIPSTLTELATMPLTPNGKIDRKALLDPLTDPQAKAQASDSYVAPSSDLERELVQLWQEMLKVDTVGVTDNFFNLGGHSLTATRLVTRVQQTYGVTIALRDLFVQPSIAALAAQIEAAESESDDLEQLAALLAELE